MTSAEKYVTAAYLVFLAVVLVYVVIFATKVSRLDRELAELTALAKGTGGRQPAAKPPVRECGPVEGAAERPVREADQGKGSGETGRFPQLPGGPGATSARQPGNSPEGERLG
ncbi:MAG: hypothetical protein H0T09_02540 [Actinobacteria bacterium]|nr:hypothetical protein [Actinomycetota bacterium]